ncbi:hypothetical protein [Streptomyces sioyaensis]|uniref:hypothetical protein n=1 Tax=Streptomyces sioyaensis TaxID=67364 RepID=UPI00371AD820
MPPSFDCPVHRSADTAALLTRLHDNRDTSFEPYLFAAWAPDLEPANALTLARLAQVLDEPLLTRQRRTGQRPARPAWHCSVVDTAGALPRSPTNSGWTSSRTSSTPRGSPPTATDPPAGGPPCATATTRSTSWPTSSAIRALGPARIHQDTWHARSACDHHARTLSAQLVH